jgi:hypothetical protein
LLITDSLAQFTQGTPCEELFFPTATAPPAWPSSAVFVGEALGDAGDLDAPAEGEADSELKFGSVVPVPSTICTWPAATEALACAVTPNSAAIAAAFPAALAP